MLAMNQFTDKFAAVLKNGDTTTITLPDKRVVAVSGLSPQIQSMVLAHDQFTLQEKILNLELHKVKKAKEQISSDILSAIQADEEAAAATQTDPPPESEQHD